MHNVRNESLLRVTHVVPAKFGSDGVLGGAERYAFELARHMAEITETTLVAFGAKQHTDRVGRLTVKTIIPNWNVRGQRSNPWSFGLLPELLKADVVHCHQQHILASSISALVCRLTGRRVFVSDLGGGGWDISSFVSTDRWYTGHLHISKYSRFVFGHENKPWASVIYGGVDTNKFSPDPTIVRGDNALFVGRLLPHKAVDDLICAIPADMPLKVIGNSCDERFVEDLHTLAVGKQVIFRHGCSDTKLIDEYRRALCIVLPSVFKDRYGRETKVPELLGQTLLEGMACGAPAICTDAASMPEIVEDGLTGFVVAQHDTKAMRDRLLWLREHPREAAVMGEAARKRVVDQFVWPRVIARCLEQYTQQRTNGSAH